MAKPKKQLSLTQETLSLLQLSSMLEEERTMWQVMLPNMLPEEVQKLHDTLEKEVKKMLSIYQKVKKAQDSQNSSAQS